MAKAEVTMTSLRIKLFEYGGKSRRPISNNAFIPSPLPLKLFLYVAQVLILSIQNATWGRRFQKVK
jgi:hypothetical protein